MKLVLQRVQEINDAVIGELSIDGKFFCYTLEDKIRDVKIKHQTCIPEGIYNVILNFSARFKVILPLLLDVPEFIGIRIHAGNTTEDTSGCILLGMGVNNQKLLHSKLAVQQFIEKVKPAVKKGLLTIEVKNPPKKVVSNTPVPISIPEVLAEVLTEVSVLPSVQTTQNQTLFTQLINLFKWLIQQFKS